MISHCADVTSTLNAAFGSKLGLEDQHINNGAPLFLSVAENQRGEIRTSDTMTQLTCGGGKPGQGYPAVMTPRGVRRLIPKECAKLQGFPPDHTAITVRGKPAADGPQYRALGNSMAVNVMAYIGERIQLAEDMQ